MLSCGCDVVVMLSSSGRGMMPVQVLVQVPVQVPVQLPVYRVCHVSGSVKVYRSVSEYASLLMSSALFV